MDEESELKTKTIQEVWNSEVPISFELAAEEVVTAESPLPFYFLCRRVSYFFFYRDMLELYFSRFIMKGEANLKVMWFSLPDGYPLKWQLPIGVLYDLYGDTKLPWRITVRFQGFPSTQIVSFPSPDDIKHHFLYQLKQSNYIKDGSGASLNNLSVNDSDNLWEGLKSNNFNRFHRINKGLNIYKDRGPVPVRILQKELPMLQSIVRDEGDSADGFTIEHLIHSQEQKLDNPEKQVIIHGLTIPMNSSLDYLYHYFHYPDNFLYIILK